MKILSIFFLIFLAACSGTVHIPLKPLANTCQLDHTQPTIMSAYGSLVCWDSNWEMKGIALTKGKSLGEVALSVGQTAAIVAGAIQAIGDIDTGTELNFDIPGQ